MNLDQGTVEQIVGILKQNQKVNEVILFGSRAKGTGKDGSDIDIALVGENIGFRDLCQLGVKLEDLDLPYKIDLVAYDSHTSPELKSHIDRVGVSIHR
jgi:uncharacterized protein